MKNFSYYTETHRCPLSIYWLSDGNKSGKPFQISRFSRIGKKLERIWVFISYVYAALGWYNNHFWGRTIHWICQSMPNLLLWSQIFQPLLDAKITPFGHKRHLSPLMAILKIYTYTPYLAGSGSDFILYRIYILLTSPYLRFVCWHTVYVHCILIYLSIRVICLPL